MYERPKPKGKGQAYFSASYHLYPTFTPSSYVTWKRASPAAIRFHGSFVCVNRACGGLTIVGCGRSASLRGNVTGSLPLGFDSAEQNTRDRVRTFAACVPCFEDRADLSGPWHGHRACRFRATTTVCGFAAATFAIRFILMFGKRKAVEIHPFTFPLISEDDCDIGVLRQSAAAAAGSDPESN